VQFARIDQAYDVFLLDGQSSANATTKALASDGRLN
jgi:hypothetical protein